MLYFAPCRLPCHPPHRTLAKLALPTATIQTTTAAVSLSLTVPTAKVQPPALAPPPPLALPLTAHSATCTTRTMRRSLTALTAAAPSARLLPPGSATIAPTRTRTRRRQCLLHSARHRHRHGTIVLPVLVGHTATAAAGAVALAVAGSNPVAATPPKAASMDTPPRLLPLLPPSLATARCATTTTALCQRHWMLSSSTWCPRWTTTLT